MAQTALKFSRGHLSHDEGHDVQGESTWRVSVRKSSVNTSTSKSRQRSPASLGPAKPRFLLEIPRQLLDVAKNRLPATQRRLNGVLVLAHPEVLDLFG